MNLKDLKYLVALADTGHFGRAAERTFVSQPTLSSQLKKLEGYLGVKLVERHPKNVQLTDVGKQIVVRARHMLSEGDEIVALARNNTDPLAGKLKVALIPTIGPYLLPRVMQKIRKALPDLGLMLYEHQTEELLRRLKGGEFDLGIVALPVEQEGLESRELYREAFTVALPNNHPLAQRSSIKTADLKGQTLLLLEDGHCLRDQALAFCTTVARGRTSGVAGTAFGASSLTTVMQMVAGGYGVTLIPQIAADVEQRDERVKFLRLQNPQPGRSIGLVFRRTSPRKADFAALGEVVKESMDVAPAASSLRAAR
jgi:LysR family transcriptional regulator, hydrogen peroxide-inducible genes activator